jgi:hypothetical protein
MENTLDLNVSHETKATDVSDYLNKTKFQYAFSSGSNVVLAFHFENEMICIKIHKEDIDFVFEQSIKGNNFKRVQRLEDATLPTLNPR